MPALQLRNLLSVLCAKFPGVSFDDSHLHHVHACEKPEAPRKLLKSYRHTPDHVFCDLLDRFPNACVDELHTMRQRAKHQLAEQIQNLNALHSSRRDTVRETKDLFKSAQRQLVDSLIAFLSTIEFDPNQHAHCDTHGHNCGVYPTSNPRSLRIVAGSSSCTDFAPYGLHEKCVGKV